MVCGKFCVVFSQKNTICDLEQKLEKQIDDNQLQDSQNRRSVVESFSRISFRFSVSEKFNFSVSLCLFSQRLLGKFRDLKSKYSEAIEVRKSLRELLKVLFFRECGPLFLSDTKQLTEVIAR